ncbi:MAG TPA: glycosyltransferase family 4 protein [Candidatus Omnitrophota bacterium]|nr:glycosyltransferase family 4 protein [Candidatus Omnitrophota bacterium]
MRVLFWVPYPKEGASNRYRVEQYLPSLSRCGIDFSVHSFWTRPAFRILYTKGNYAIKVLFFIIGTICRLVDVAIIFRYDIVFIHREAYPVGPAVFETILKTLRKPMIFDFDDAIFLAASSRQNFFVERFKCTRKIKDIIGMSSHVIAGNNYLASFARPFNSKVSVIPTVIDTDRYVPVDHPRGDRIVIGWIGSATTADFLRPMEGVLRAIAERFPQVDFVLVGASEPVPGIERMIVKAWSLPTELQDLASFDIGIMPMPDDPWTRGKCAFKAIIYMGMSIPCVCSAVGTNNEIIDDGVNGFLATSDEEWIEKLSLLIRDPAVRRKVGVAGRKTVEDRYSLKAYADTFVRILASCRKGGAGCA